MPKRKGSSDAGVDAKRQCLDLAGLTGITTSGLQQATHAISVIYGDPGTPKITQSSIARRWLKEYKLYGRTLDLELETEDGERNGTFKWYICDLALLINFCCKRSTLLTKAFEEVCGEFGRVLHMIFYCDEFTPGNVLAPDTSRKSWGFYVSFREFGPARLCHQEFWFAIGVLRTGIENQVVGGLSNIIRLLMRMCFTEPVNIRDPGIVVALGGRMEYIRIEFGQILADTDALRAALSLKGANGIKPCMCCGNCVKKGNRSSRPGTGIFDILHHDLKDFRRCKCTDIWASVDRLEAELGTLNITSFRKLEKTIGFKCTLMPCWQTSRYESISNHRKLFVMTPCMLS